MLGTVNVKLRPIKLAFLIDPNDEKVVLKAIEMNSFLWGGVYNPIIPLVKRLPKAWKKHSDSIPSARQVALAYIDAYDPDFVVPLGNCDAKPLGLDKDRIIAVNDIWASVPSDGTPAYGVGLFEILRHLIDTEFKFVRRNPLQVYFTELEKQNELFLASVFGKLPTDIEQVLKQHYRGRLGAEDRAVNVGNYAKLLNPSAVFSRRLTSLHINARASRSGMRDACIFFLDAQNPWDIVDYWNLRAMAWPVIPVPKQGVASNATKQLAKEFIEEHFGQSRYNADIFHHTTVMASRSVEEKDVQNFVGSLNIPQPQQAGAYKYVFQPWYPRIWDEWARDKDGVYGCELEAGEASYEFSEGDTRINAKSVDPKFVARFAGQGEPRFSNTLEFHIYGGKELMAQVIPAGTGYEMVRGIGAMPDENWRFSRRELVHFVERPDSTVYLSLPVAKDVFSGWMQSKGWGATPSSPGNIAYQMMRRLGGSYGLSILSHEGVLNLLRKLENGRVVSKEEFAADIARAANQNRFLRDRVRIAEWLLEGGMIRLGAELQCPSCQQRSWFSLKDLDSRLQCHNCNEHFDVPAASPDKIKWAYRAFGPFSLPGRAYGVYSVLLTLRFFSHLLHHVPITPMLSFLAKKDGKEIEVDLGLFLKETRFGISDTRLIFAECKNNDEFKKQDVDKMKWLAEKFPGAVIVFATLNKQLSEKEKKLITPFVNKGRRQWKTEMPYNPVLILTATELLADLGPPTCWRDPSHKPFAEQYQRSWRELIPLCDVTQQMYLGLKPWSQWLDERLQRTRKIKAVAI